MSKNKNIETTQFIPPTYSEESQFIIYTFEYTFILINLTKQIIITDSLTIFSAYSM
jgi:hypothetical protein